MLPVFVSMRCCEHHQRCPTQDFAPGCERLCTTRTGGAQSLGAFADIGPNRRNEKSNIICVYINNIYIIYIYIIYNYIYLFFNRRCGKSNVST